MKVGCDGSNDDPNLFCNFPGIDSLLDVPVAKPLLRCLLFPFAIQISSVKNKEQPQTETTQGPVQ